jgi:hypothetical protein
MPQVIKRVLKNRWFVVGVHAGLWFLLYLALAHLGGKAPEFREAAGVPSPLQSPTPVAGLGRLFLPGIWPKSLVQTNLLNPFYTLYFVPPPPPPPTTRKIQVTYQGYSQTATGATIAYLRVDDLTMVAPSGTRITNDTFIADVTLPALILTNANGQTNTVGLNTNKELVIPIK